MHVFQRHIPYDVLSPKSLPGVAPLDAASWLMVDEAYAGQMTLRRDMLDRLRGDVLQLDPSGLAAAQELLDHVLDFLADAGLGFQIEDTRVICPDGHVQPLDRADPLGVLGRVMQNDFCILEKPDGGAEHILTGAVLCFPANWRLAEKFMQPLTHIHTPVPEYDPNIAKRVQRLFDGIGVGRPLWRSNALWYTDAKLHQPAKGGNPRPVDGGEGPNMRSERQTFYRLPLTGAVVFGIHTFLVRRQDVLNPST